MSDVCRQTLQKLPVVSGQLFGPEAERALELRKQSGFRCLGPVGKEHGPPSSTSKKTWCTGPTMLTTPKPTQLTFLLNQSTGQFFCFGFQGQTYQFAVHSTCSASTGRQSCPGGRRAHFCCLVFLSAHSSEVRGGNNGMSVQGVWCPQWRGQHINARELQTVYLTLKHFVPFLKGKHVLVPTDNTSTVFHVNHQGGAVHWNS